MGDPALFQSRIEGLETQRRSLQREYDAIALALEVLAASNGALQNRFVGTDTKQHLSGYGQRLRIKLALVHRVNSSVDKHFFCNHSSILLSVHRLYGMPLSIGDKNIRIYKQNSCHGFQCVFCLFSVYHTGVFV